MAKVIFHHIPKTAGIYTFYRLCAACNCEGNSYGHWMNQLDFQEDNPDPPVIGGHFFYDFIRLRREGALVFTILRDPIERVISNYRHIISPDRGYGWQGDISDFLADPRTRPYALNNHCMFLGSAIEEEHLPAIMSSVEEEDAIGGGFGRIMRYSSEAEDQNDLLERALRNLHSYDCIVCQHDLVSGLGHILDDIFPGHDVQLEQRRTRTDGFRISEGDRVKIEDLNRQDLILFEEVKTWNWS